jgi:lysozyme
MSSAPTINAEGLAIVKESEGLSLKAYKCPAGIWTLGYGSTKGVKKGMSVTAAEAVLLLQKDLKVFEDGVWALTEIHSPTSNRFSAMVSLAFNIGMKAFQGSSVLRTFRAGDFHGASKSFELWNKATVDGVKKVLPGLVVRRRREAGLFASP